MTSFVDTKRVSDITVSPESAMVAVPHQMRQDGEATLEQAGASLVLATEHGFPYLRAVGSVLHGWGLTRRGRIEAGVSQMRQGPIASRAIEAEVLQPHLLALKRAGKMARSRKDCMPWMKLWTLPTFIASSSTSRSCLG
jgi:hypothetical protein